MKHAPLLWLVYHHSAGSRSTTAADIDRMHRNRKPRPFRMSGYNGVIEESGEFVVARRLGAGLAANPPFNRCSIAICITGNNTVPEHEWNDDQIATARTIWAGFKAMGFMLAGHGDIGSTKTACPGLDVNLLFENRPWAGVADAKEVTRRRKG